MYCPKCGSNVGNFEFCPQCGANVCELIKSIENSINEFVAEEKAEQIVPTFKADELVEVETTEEQEDINLLEESDETTEENKDEIDNLFTDYLEPLTESDDKVADIKKKSKKLKIIKIIAAIIIAGIVVAGAFFVYETHFRYAVFKVPPLSETSKYLLEEGSVPQYTIPPKVEIPKRPNIKRLLSNINYESKEVLENGQTLYKIALRDKKTVYGAVWYDKNNRIESFKECEPCDEDTELKRITNYHEKVLNDSFIDSPVLKPIPKYNKNKYLCEYYYENHFKAETWYDLGGQPYYYIRTYEDNPDKYGELRFDENGNVTYAIVNFHEQDYYTIVAVFKNNKVAERWCFDENGVFLRSVTVSENN